MLWLKKRPRRASAWRWLMVRTALLTWRDGPLFSCLVSLRPLFPSTDLIWPLLLKWVITQRFSVLFSVLSVFFSSWTLLVWWQEGHPVHKKPVPVIPRSCLSREEENWAGLANHSSHGKWLLKCRWSDDVVTSHSSQTRDAVQRCLLCLSVFHGRPME